MANLTAFAIAAYTETELLRAEQEKTSAEEADQMSVTYAVTSASRILGQAAHPLVFEPIAADSLAAEADLPGAPGFKIRYVYSDDDESSRLFLVRPCSHCGHTAVDEIRSLPHLGDLLTDGPTTA